MLLATIAASIAPFGDDPAVRLQIWGVFALPLLLLTLAHLVARSPRVRRAWAIVGGLAGLAESILGATALEDFPLIGFSLITAGMLAIVSSIVAWAAARTT